MQIGCVSDLQCVSQNSVLKVSEVGLKFLKFAMNLVISFRSCQSNREREFHAELRREVIKFIAREVRAIG